MQHGWKLEAVAGMMMRMRSHHNYGCWPGNNLIRNPLSARNPGVSCCQFETPPPSTVKCCLAMFLETYVGDCLSTCWAPAICPAVNKCIRGAHGSHFWSIFFHFCRRRPSKMKWKMRTVNLPPSKFWKMSEKMSEKWNSTFFGTLAALNSTSHSRPCSILSFPQCLLSASNLPWVFTNWSSVH